MAAPRGATYTPKRGPLAGRTFAAPAGRTAPTAAYNAYQNALAAYKTGGRATTYAQQRRQEDRGLIATITSFIQSHGDDSRSEAREKAREFWQGEPYHGPTRPASGPGGPGVPGGKNSVWGRRKNRLMKWLAEEGYITSESDRNDAWDELYY